MAKTQKGTLTLALNSLFYWDTKGCKPRWLNVSNMRTFTHTCRIQRCVVLQPLCCKNSTVQMLNAEFPQNRDFSRCWACALTPMWRSVCIMWERKHHCSSGALSNFVTPFFLVFPNSVTKVQPKLVLHYVSLEIRSAYRLTSRWEFFKSAAAVFLMGA